MMPTAGNAEYVKKHDGWYAIWPQPDAVYWLHTTKGRERISRPARYMPALGPFRFRWLARLAVRKSIL